jgi:hypothetical protein
MGSNDWLISVDHHVVEPPHVWTDSLAAKQWVHEDKPVSAPATPPDRTASSS